MQITRPDPELGHATAESHVAALRASEDISLRFDRPPVDSASYHTGELINGPHAKAA